MEINETVVGELSSLADDDADDCYCLGLSSRNHLLNCHQGTVYQSDGPFPQLPILPFHWHPELLVSRTPFDKDLSYRTTIIDDLCAILIIAFFYGGQPKFTWLLGVAASILIIILVIKYLKSPFSRILYLSLGMVMWYCMYQSGIHATFAGVILSALLPIKKIPVYEKILLFPVNFLIIPIFALANTSIAINASAIANLTGELSIGIVLGLLIGKPVGISLGVYLMTKMRIIRSKSKPDWMLYVGVGILAGIGFTMSIFVSTLAFEDRSLQDTAKLAVLIASTLSMIIGYAWLKIALKKRQVEL